ncbi:MAG TPA: phospholipase D-like domain-containing protein [Chloroflexota bacterium]|nr:phospholipase D-like domain-containing protein [Chloroflexota bacterium]
MGDNVGYVVGRDSASGLSLTAYPGDGAVLLAFDLAQEKTAGFAGFAVKCRTPDKGPYPTNEYFLTNRLSFETPAPATPGAPEKVTSSDKAPFQTFHWVHFPGAGDGDYTYTVYATYFNPDGSVRLGGSVSAEVTLAESILDRLKLGFTRGYISSQAFSDRFTTDQLRPKKTLDYATAPYQKEYAWLGAHARKLVFDFLAECAADPRAGIDAFTFDFDEPDIVEALVQLAKSGHPVRVFQDNSSEHNADSVDQQAARLIADAGGQVKYGHFGRFAHDKVFIQKIAGQATKVLTGSANFAIRGLYVQANSVLVFDDATLAGLYEAAFEQAFDDAGGFSHSAIAADWHAVDAAGVPKLKVSFAPHQSPPFSITTVGEAIKGATSSVMFAIMQMTGTGEAMDELKALGDRPEILSLGTIDKPGELGLFASGQDHVPPAVARAALVKHVPPPFGKEFTGGMGQVIHHKFVVCDFNGDNPVVFCGSSNLAAGGESANGDNLLAISDRRVVTAYAVEALRLYDHYRFRSLAEAQPSEKPLQLARDDTWAARYYDPNTFVCRERVLLAK